MRDQLFSRPALMLVTDRKRVGARPRDGEEVLDDVVREAVLGGVDIVQLREKDLSTSELIALGLHVRDAIAGRALFFVNGDLEAARALRADGIHLPANAPSVSAARDALGDHVLVSVAAHNIDDARRTERDGADFVVLGAVFETASHPDTTPLGIDAVRDVCAALHIPVIAIGGITPDNARSCIDADAAGVAVISAIMDAPDPRVAAANIRAVIATSDQRPTTDDHQQ
jgi:thiamine-phosphate diphosphorylase